ncbi:MAG: DUF3267 domain-containing protein [Bacteroidales bacterium]|nr:DUF3267 domain-containing protein [Bacteroidales bacterium]
MRELTIDSSKANLLGLAFLIPVGLFAGVPFYLLWHQSIDLFAEIVFLKSELVWALLVLLSFVAVHELLHALAYIILTNGDYKNIKFGVIWKDMTPYCHYNKSIAMSKYRVALATPGLITGIIPLFVSLTTGDFLLFILALFLTLGAVGDFIILWISRKEKSSSIVKDHPEKIGCIIIEE